MGQGVDSQSAEQRNERLGMGVADRGPTQKNPDELPYTGRRLPLKKNSLSLSQGRRSGTEGRAAANEAKAKVNWE